MKKCFRLSTFYLILGLFLGVFYRELTKFNNFSGITVLSNAHTHILVLGFIFFLIVLLLEHSFKLSNISSFNKWIVSYNISLLYFISTLVFKGILQVNNTNFSGLSHIAGLGHVLLAASFAWFMIILNKAIKNPTL